MLHLSAGLFAAAAFEAYLNYLGLEMLPTVWAKEREFFSSKEYRGVDGKLRRLAQELNWPLLPRNRKPFSGLIELQALRDKIVHARPKKDTYSRVHRSDKLLAVPAMWLYHEARPKRIRILIKDAEAVAVSLHIAVLQSQFRDLIFDVHPFIGALGFGTHSVAAVD